MIGRGGDEPKEPGGRTVPPDRGEPGEQPKWRRDFPIDAARSAYVARRDFVKFLVLTSAALATGQLWIVGKSARRRGERSFPAVSIGTLDELPVGGAKTFRYPEGSTPRLLVRTSERDFVAYDQQCTHLLCPVVPAVDAGRLHCPCHNGWFDLSTGAPLAGPPRRPLPRITLEVRGDTIYATGVEESST